MSQKVETRTLTFLLIIIILVLLQTTKDLREAAHTFSDRCESLDMRLNSIEEVNSMQDEAIKEISVRDDPSSDLP